jgi:hypothetical protein
MRGVGRTVLQLLCLSSALQIWLLAIGLIVTIVGLTARVDGWHPAAADPWSVLTILGLITTVAAPLVLTPLLFRAISAPRSVGLIPYARLQLLLGALGSQLLLCLFIGLVVAALLSGATAGHAPPGATMARITVFSFGCLTLHFIGFFCTSQSKLSVLWLGGYAIWPRLIVVSLAPRHLGELLATGPALGTLLAISLLGWLCFGVAYVRTRRIAPVFGGGIGGATSAAPMVVSRDATARQPRQYGDQQAVRLLLLGPSRKPSTQSGVLVVAALVLIALIILLTSGRISARGWLIPIAAVTLFAATIPGIYAGWMTLRARSLWLTSKWGRPELFRMAELHSLRMVAVFTAIALGIELPVLILSVNAAPTAVRLIGILAMPPVTGAAFVYVSLLGIPERRLVYVLVSVACAAVIGADFLCLIADTSLLTKLLATQVILLPILRNIAQRRWQHLDWLINRPSRLLAKVI